LTTAVSGTVGLGNIAGVAVAVSLGGPGAALWMVLAGFLGMSAKFAEVTLAVKYRRVRADGTVSGGPMYYIPIALARVGLPRVGVFLAGFFCVATIGGSLTLFQVNQSFEQFRAVTGFEQGFVFGLAIALWVGVILFGGMRRIARTTSRLVPLMCALYIVACVVVLLANAAQLPAALATIVHSAFVPESVAGGIIGAIVQGFRRAAFSSEAGLGSAPMAHATVRTREPMSQGFAALLEPFLDTVVICLLTALAIVVSWRLPAGWRGAGHRADLSRVRDRRAVVPDRAVRRRDPVRAVDAAELGLLRRTGLDLAFFRQPGQPRRLPAVPVRGHLDRCDVRTFAGHQPGRLAELLHGDPEPDRRVPAAAGTARRPAGLPAPPPRREYARVTASTAGGVPLRRLTPRKLLQSKWTAVVPQGRQKHFVVVRLIERDSPTLPLEHVEIEAVHSKRRRIIEWRELRDPARWHQGWR
jgi:tryptophan-rich hypothetical protein